MTRQVVVPPHEQARRADRRAPATAAPGPGAT
eukprot:CAMPEP_0179171302 /NCGR_PEP_ID=MMETSP0796-20121207/84437_1 /TAXON_ID=73915 /ORGANISM="Pyrodinium bahamense, Strain pbaha01" /LENGTH=31 /DNA_ID= /DNA_START= /DNA_END= /DNA_ORIENTATION=